MSTLKIEHITNISRSGEDLSIDTNGNIGIAMTPDSAVKLSVTGAIGPTNGTDAAPTHTFYSDPDTGMYRSGANALSFSTGGSNALTLNSSQNASFAGTITGSSSITATTTVNVGTGGGFYLKQDNSESTIRSESQPIVLQTYASSAWNDRLTVTNSGNVGVGGTPDEKMHLYTDAGTTLYKAEVNANSTVGLEIKKTGTTTQSWRIVDGETVNGALQFYDVTDSAVRMHIDGDGNVGIGTTTPNAYTDYTTLTINHNTNGGMLDIERNGNLVGELYTTSATDFGIQTGQATGAMRFRTNAGEVLTLLHTGEVGIGATSPQFKLHVNKGSDNYATFSGVDENIAGFQTSYDASGSQILTFSNLDGNWVDGTSGADSAFGWVWGYQTSVRGGLVYDHRGSERMQMFSSYGTISFLTADAADGNAVPTDSNMNERLTIAPGGDVTITADSKFRSTDSSSRTSVIVSPTNVVHTGAYPYHPGGDGIGNNQTNSLQMVFAHIYQRVWSSGRYMHIKTNIPVSGSNYGMVVVYAKGYRYSPAGSIDSSWGFHNWGTTIYSLDQRNYAVTFAVNCYKSSDNYVVLVGDNQTTGTSYTGFQLSFLYSNTNYPAHTQTMNGDSHKVLAASLSSSTSGVY